ncbi:MAG: hypothetical protein AB7G44_02360 [Bacteroidia bacterium]
MFILFAQRKEFIFLLSGEMISIAHIINPVKAKHGSELSIAQPIVFEAMRKAKAFATDVDVKLFSAQYAEDAEIIPEYFQKTTNLENAVVINGKKKLPLIKDILQRLFENSNSEYLIYTNTDIIVLPQFYETLARIIEQGYDAFIINRRRIPKVYNSVNDLPFIYSDIGKSHPGFDCFVFKRELFPKFILGEICVGIPFVEATLMHNLFAHAEKCKLFDGLHLTAHIGMDVMPKRDGDYYHHNRQEFEKIKKELQPLLSLKKMPYAEYSFPARILKKALNPAVFTMMNLELEKKSAGEKISFLWNELRFRLLKK